MNTVSKVNRLLGGIGTPLLYALGALVFGVRRFALDLPCIPGLHRRTFGIYLRLQFRYWEAVGSFFRARMLFNPFQTSYLCIATWVRPWGGIAENVKPEKVGPRLST